MSDNDHCAVTDAMAALVLYTSFNQQEIGKMEVYCYGLEINRIQKEINSLEERLHEQQIIGDDSQHKLIGLRAEKSGNETKRRYVQLTGRPLVTVWEAAIKEGGPGVPEWARIINEELQQRSGQVDAGTETANQNLLAVLCEPFEQSINDLLKLAQENIGLQEDQEDQEVNRLQEERNHLEQRLHDQQQEQKRQEEQNEQEINRLNNRLRDLKEQQRHQEL